MRARADDLVSAILLVLACLAITVVSAPPLPTGSEPPMSTPPRSPQTPPMACVEVTDACERGCRQHGDLAETTLCMAECDALFERCLERRQELE